MDSSTQTSADEDIKLNSDLFDLAEKLRIELQKKDKELEDKNEENKELSANLDLAMSRANQVDELQHTIHALQMSLWKSFPSPDHRYYIKTQSGSQNGQFICAYTESGIHYLRSSAAVQPCRDFKFTKNSDGTFSIYSGSKRNYLQINNSSRVKYTLNNGSAEKFVLCFHQQNQKAGLLVDICSLSGSFLSVEADDFVVAKSSAAPTDKFLIIPVGVE